MSEVASGSEIRRYKAFLSYSHRDSAAGNWIHKAIEAYRIPKDLVGRKTSRGPVPASLRPIFRDRYDLSAAPSLKARIEQALDQSDTLLVLCSMASAKSPYVDAEIRRFKVLGRGSRILALILDGEPHDRERECFPAALKFKVDRNGALTTEPDIEPIAADAREHADGRELARLKIIAGLLELGLDEIRKREAIAERARRRMWMTIAGVMAGLAVLATIASVIAVQRTRDAERRFDLAFKAATTQVKRIDGLQDQMGVSEPVLEGLIVDSVAQLEKLTGETGAHSDSFQFNRAEAQLLAADLARRRGQSASQLSHLDNAIAALEPLAARDPDNVNAWRGELAAALDRRGATLKETGQTEKATADYSAAHAIFEHIGTREGATLGDIDKLAYWYSTSAARMTAAAEGAQKLATIQKAMALRRKLVAEAPENIEFQRGFGLSLLQLAAASAPPGASDADLAAAEAISSEAVGLFTRLSGNAPRDGDLAHQLGRAFSARADLRAGLKHFDEARADYMADLNIEQAEAQDNPQNLRTQLDYAVTLGRIGLLDIATGKSTAGVLFLRKALEVETRVAARDRTNVDFQNIATKRSIEIATQLKKDGDIEGAANAYRQAIALRDAAAADLPTRGAYAIDRIGQRLFFSRFMEAAGRKAEALQALEEARDIATEKIGAFDPVTNNRIQQLKAKLEDDIVARR